jgi:hypothetical protein
LVGNAVECENRMFPWLGGLGIAVGVEIKYDAIGYIN